MKQGWMAAGLVGMAVGLAGAEPPRYRMIPLAPAAGHASPIAGPTDINDSGLIVGMMQTARGSTGFSWFGGVLTELAPLPGFATTRAECVNNSGDIIGESQMQALAPARATMWRDGAAVDLVDQYGVMLSVFDINDAGVMAGVRDVGGSRPFGPALFDVTGVHDLPMRAEWPDATAYALNGKGQTVGWYSRGAGRFGPVAWLDGGIRDLPVPADLGSASAHEVNEDGWIIGSGWTAGYQELGLLWRGEEVIRIGAPADGVRNSYPFDINDRGEIIALIDSESSFGFYLWSDGVLTDIESLLEPGTPWRLVSAYSINNLGQIAGEAMIDGRQVGVLLDPIPAPGPLVLLGLAAARRRR